MSTTDTELRPSPEWVKLTGVRVLGADGWHGKDAKSFYEPISRVEFLDRCRDGSTLETNAEGWALIHEHGRS